MEVAVPAGLYGMAIAEPAHLDRKLDGNLVYIVEMIRVQSMLLLNYLVTCLFIFQIWSMNQRRHVAECAGSLLLLELGCVFLFEVRILIDVRKAVSIMWLLWAAPQPLSSPAVLLGSNRSKAPKTPKAGAVLANENAPEEESLLFRMYRGMRRKRDDPQEVQWKLDGLSRRYRLWCLFTVGLPKLVVSLVLAYLGGIYIMRSGSDGVMVMSTASVVFIAEIEHSLYVAFTSDAMRYNLEHMQPVEVCLNNRLRLAGWLVSSILGPLLTISVAALVVYHARQLDCHGHGWNTRELMSAFHPSLRGAVAHQ